MKKKIFAFVSMIIVLSFVLAGCNMFVTNAQRDAHQVVASVEYKDTEKNVYISADITKQEYAYFFNQNYSTYSYYYGFTAEECADMFINILAKQKMLVMLASVAYTPSNGTIPNLTFNEETGMYDYEAYANALISILSPDEQKYVREQTNKTFQDSFDKIFKELEEQDKIEEDVEEDKEDADKVLKPRPMKPVVEDTEFKKDSSVTIEDANSVVNFFTDKKPTDKSSDNYKEAFSNVEKSLEAEYRSYHYYIAKQAESRLTTRYTESNNGFDVSIIDANSKYTVAIESQTELYKDSEKYKTDIETDEGAILVHNGEFVKVKSVLLKFSADQEALLATLKEKFPEEKYQDYIISLREIMIFGDSKEFEDKLDQMPIPVKEELLGLTVNVSKLDYEPGTADKDTFDKTAVPFLEVIADMGRAIAKAEADAMISYDEKYANLDGYDINSKSYTTGKQMYVTEKKIEEFENWIYMVNDDDGMFQGKDYVETPLGQDSSYVPEYTALVRQLLMDNKTAGSITVDHTTNNAFVNGLAEYTSTIQVDGVDVEVKHSATGNIVTTTAKLKDEEIVIYTDTTNDMSFIINDFGVHIVMLTNVTVEEYNKDLITSVANPDFDEDKYPSDIYTPEEIQMIKDANRIYTMSKEAYIGFDDETGKAITVIEQYTNELTDTYESDAYSKYEKSLFDRYGDSIFDASDDVAADTASKFTFKHDNGLLKSMKNAWIKIEKDMKAQEEQQQA